MLASEAAHEDPDQMGMESLVDAGNIFSYKLIRTLNRQAHIVVEVSARLGLG